MAVMLCGPAVPLAFTRPDTCLFQGVLLSLDEFAAPIEVLAEVAHELAPLEAPKEPILKVHGNYQRP